MTFSDNKIWNKITQSDTKSFELLYNRYHDQLCLYSYGLISNVEATEEIVNDVFLRIWNKRNQLTINIGIRPYLFRCVYNACIDYHKKNYLPKQSECIEIDKKINELVEQSEEYIFDLFQNEIVENDILKAIELLPRQCRTIFCMSRYELLTYSEISERMNISMNTVKTQISRALESLRKQLNKYLQ